MTGRPVCVKFSHIVCSFPSFTDDSGVVCIGVSRNEQSVGSMPGSLVDSVGYSSSGKILMETNNVEAAAYKQGLFLPFFLQFKL